MYAKNLENINGRIAAVNDAVDNVVSMRAVDCKGNPVHEHGNGDCGCGGGCGHHHKDDGVNVNVILDSMNQRNQESPVVPPSYNRPVVLNPNVNPMVSPVVQPQTMIFTMPGGEQSPPIQVDGGNVPVVPVTEEKRVESKPVVIKKVLPVPGPKAKRTYYLEWL